MATTVKAVVVRVDGKAQLEQIPAGEAESFEALRKIVGGYVEMFPIRELPGVVVACNEDGGPMGLPPNPNVLMNLPGGWVRALVGDYAVIGYSRPDDPRDLTDEETKWLLAHIILAPARRQGVG